MAILGRSALLLTPLGLLVVWGSNRLLNVLAPDECVWVAHDISMSLSFAMAALMVAQLTPYKNLRQKCIAALVAGCAIVDIAFSIAKPSGYLIWISSQALGGSALAIFYWKRSYSHGAADCIESGRIYCIRRSPSSLQDFLIALSGIYGTDGGYSLYANGYLYKYSGGRLVRRKVSSVPSIGYHVCRGSRIDESVMSELDSLVGSKWSWSKNCLTVLAPIWRRHSG
jgi:hypothetical protein